MLTITKKYGNLGNNLYQLLGIIYMSEKINDKINIKKLKESEINKIFKLQELQDFINKNKEKKERK